MKIVDIKATDGPNYWSVCRTRLMIMTLDLENLEDRPSHKIPGFYERLKNLLPSLSSHRCSEGVEGGFFQRVQRGTWMGHVIEHIALEIQTLAGMETGFGRTRDAGRKGLYHVVFSCQEPNSGRYAAEAAVRIVEQLIDGKPCDLPTELSGLCSIYTRYKLGPSTQSIVDEARKRNIPFIRLNDDSLIQLGYGAAQHRIEAAVADTTSHIAVSTASDKQAAKQLLAAGKIPVPEGNVIENTDELPGIIQSIGYPLVIKPADGNHGRGVTIDICDEATAFKAFASAKSYSSQVIVEKLVAGHDYRVLVVNYNMVAAAHRTPPFVIGDGTRNITELVEELNRDPRRGTGHENFLTSVTIDASTEAILQRQGLSSASVLSAGEQVFLKTIANLSTGGTATDVTDIVHPDNITLFERAARIIGLDICGLDVVATDLCTPIVAIGRAVLEINVGPGLRMHLHPTKGKARNVAVPILDMLFPNGANGRIPILAVTGTNGKTTTTRLIAHIMTEAGYNTGCTTTEGVYIGNKIIETGDCTGPVSARMVLQDRSVNCAVLECARGGILRAGLGFDACDVAVITNIAEEHLGLKGIDSIEKLTQVKAVVAESASRDGYVVLNADDDQVYGLRKGLAAEVILFSLRAGSSRIKEHISNDGTAVVCENDELVIITGGIKTVLGPIAPIPVTFSGKAIFNIANALAATAAAYAKGVAPAIIYQSLLSFIPSFETLPGRMNMFDFGDFTMVVDYAHNTHGVQAVSSFLKSVPASVRVGVVAGIGDRREQDTISLGSESAKIFDEIIIRQDADLRGRKADEINEMICRGIRKVDPDKKISIIPDENEAVKSVIEHAVKGMVAVVFADNINAVIQQIRQALPNYRAISLQDIPDTPNNAAA